jgi:hypothetical protein
MQTTTLTFPSTSSKSTMSSKAERALFAVAIIDQALQTLFELENLSRAPSIGRSVLFDLISLDRRFSSADRPISQLSNMASAGKNILRLGSEWKNTVQNAERKSARHYYKVASLAVSTLAVAWLILKKRD